MLNTKPADLPKTHFYKYQGAGNDFILIDNRQLDFQYNDYLQIRQLCDRRFGIGADGLMLLQLREGYDFEMLYFNADGKPGSMCGNGGRCIVAFARQLGIIDKETDFLAVDGPHYARISAAGNQVDLQMINVAQISRDGEAFVLNTGSPHYVEQVSGLKEKDVYTSGKAIRNNDTYRAEGINVNFAEDMGDYVFVRTFERGVEDETYACGTGVTAVALALAADKGLQGAQQTRIEVPGGKLQVSFRAEGGSFSHIFLCGPAELVFEGDIRC